jgi:hypothetical protein
MGGSKAGGDETHHGTRSDRPARSIWSSLRSPAVPQQEGDRREGRVLRRSTHQGTTPPAHGGAPAAAIKDARAQRRKKPPPLRGRGPPPPRRLPAAAAERGGRRRRAPRGRRWGTPRCRSRAARERSSFFLPWSFSLVLEKTNTARVITFFMCSVHHFRTSKMTVKRNSILVIFTTY